MSQLVGEAAKALERRVFFEQLAAGYEALLADSFNTWDEIEAERAAESCVLRDSS